MSQGIWLPESQTTIFGIEPLLEFRAGICEIRNGFITPLPNKGLISLTIEPDQLLHFKWRDLALKKVSNVNNLIIFKDDCEFVRIKQCSDGRVYMLKWKNSKKKKFFWLQEVEALDDSEEESILNKVNKIFQNPNAKEHLEKQQSKMMDALEDKLDTPVNRRNNNAFLDQNMFNQALQMIGINNGNNRNNNNRNNNNNNNSNLNNLLKQQQALDHMRVKVELNTVLKRSEIITLLKNDNKLLKTFSQFLPKVNNNNVLSIQQISEHLNSPQFNQSVNMLDYAIQTGQVTPKTLGLDFVNDDDDDERFREVDILMGIQKPKKIWTLESLLRAIQKYYDDQTADGDEDKMDTSPD